ncbi:MAG: glucose-1-phosphate thymidylyltransferase [Nanoarchaeota archaeon]|nr:glucose-1-phosphate thymidylyltransferase [Nanoarchaeota archaeon]
MENFKPRYYFSEKAISKYKEIFEVEYVWQAIGKISNYLEKALENKDVEKGENTIIEQGAVIKGPVIIGNNCKIMANSYIQGPAIIGNNTEIRPGTYIRGNVIIGDYCEIRSELKNAIMMDKSHAAHLSYIGDSIVGERSNLGAGTILSNLSLSEKPIILKIQDKEIDTGMKKFGAILGEDVHAGSNVLTNPGTLVGKNSFIYPNAVVRKGFYNSNSIIKLKQDIEIVEKE